ncbi:hypothetical protein ACFU6I_15735 [Streptomyces sp. NPDC057486]|uniref:hypothetical protein n=1 Tax=Streptomyces sp. NPDC057486 TaxID=3346145 RepID=UPI0036A0B905
MQLTAGRRPLSPEPPRPPHPTQWVLYALIGIVLTAVGALIGVVTLYLIWQHPGLAAPIAAAGVVSGLFITIVSFFVTIALARR